MNPQPVLFRTFRQQRLSRLRSIFLSKLSICLALVVCQVGYGQVKPPYQAQLKRASELFDARHYDEAVPVLEALLLDHSHDDQVVFGLGVALVMVARKQKDTDARRETTIRARSVLEAARRLGVQDQLLDWYWDDLMSDLEQAKTRAVEDLAVLWNLHPPFVFDTTPPEGIQLPELYRHKSSRDFEGIVAGEIWKQGGLKITYESPGLSREDALADVDRNDGARYEEGTVGNCKFKFRLTSENWLTIALLRIGTTEQPIARFDCRITQPEDIKLVLSIIVGLKKLK